MCLARYSPRATTINQLTNTAPNEPARPICAQESISGDQKGTFSHRFLVGHSTKMDQKGKYLALFDQKCQFMVKFGHFRCMDWINKT